jgi:FkbM family methyltransferase
MSSQMELKTAAIGVGASALRAYVAHFPIWRGKRTLVRVFGRLTEASAVELEALTRFGSKMRCNIREYIESRIFLFGVWEPNLTDFLTGRLSRGDVFLDIGANVGYFSLLASKLVGTEGLVVAVEASPSTYSRLVSNVEMNGCTNVRAMNVAASAMEGTVSVFKGPETNVGTGSILESSRLPFEAKIRSVPASELLSADEFKRCRVIKIDVEGGESPILENLLANLGRLGRATEIVVELCPDEAKGHFGSVDELLRRLRSAGYAAYGLENNYSYWAYRLGAAPVPPRILEEAPKERMDLVLSPHSGMSEIRTP